MSGIAELPSATTSDRPLVVDLDGTLIRSDMLVEAFFALAGTDPHAVGRALPLLRSGRAGFKAALAKASDIDVSLLPYNAHLLAFLNAEKARGRRVYLASESDRRQVEAVAAH